MQRLVREIHRVLLEGVRGRERTPGEFRQHQNWIGLSTNDRLADAVFVPPPPDEMNIALNAWEHFNHEEVEIPHSCVALSSTISSRQFIRSLMAMDGLAACSSSFS